MRLMLGNKEKPMTTHDPISNRHNTPPKDKFRPLVYFLIKQCTEYPHKLGAIRLNKALWFADVFYYLSTGEQMTESVYFRRKFGPVPQHVLRVVRGLRDENVITIREPVFPFDVRHFAISKENQSIEFDDPLSEKEEIFAKAALDFVLGYSASEISEFTHDDIWQDTPEGNEMRVSKAAKRIQNKIFTPEEIKINDLRVEEAILKLNALQG